MWRISDKTVQQADVKSTLSPGKTDPTKQLKSFTTAPDVTFRIWFCADCTLLLHTNGY